MAFPDHEAERAHQTAEHTTRFVEILYPNCEEAPSFVDLTLSKSADHGAKED